MGLCRVCSRVVLMYFAAFTLSLYTSMFVCTSPCLFVWGSTLFAFCMSEPLPVPSCGCWIGKRSFAEMSLPLHLLPFPPSLPLPLALSLLLSVYLPLPLPPPIPLSSSPSLPLLVCPCLPVPVCDSLSLSTWPSLFAPLSLLSLFISCLSISCLAPTEELLVLAEPRGHMTRNQRNQGECVDWLVIMSAPSALFPSPFSPSLRPLSSHPSV